MLKSGRPVEVSAARAESDVASTQVRTRQRRVGGSETKKYSFLYQIARHDFAIGKGRV